MLKELLQKYLVEGDKVNQFLSDMKAAKIYTASEENLDKRYAKLKGDFDAKDQEHQEALALIEQLQQSNAGNDALQAQIAQFQNTIATLELEKSNLLKENALKMALLENKAKADDIDYLMFKMQNGDKEIKVDEKGEITNLKELVEGMKTTFPTHFEAAAKKKVDVQELPKDDGEKNTITKEQFNKMGYNAKNQLFHENKELYEQLSKGE